MSPQVEVLWRLLLAVFLGAAVGFQREKAGKPAGLRTHALICLGSALFTLVSLFGFGVGVDPSRVAAGVVTGIGFLGAGVILRGLRGNGIVGLTTAASIWTTAAIGLAAGTGMYLVALVVTGVTVGVLMLPKIRE